jgi:hypothetical protein
MYVARNPVRIEDKPVRLRVAVRCDRPDWIGATTRSGQVLAYGYWRLFPSVVIIKIGYLEPELFAMAADWKMALTPGGVDQELTRLGHHRIHRPMFPFDPEMDDPDLTARIVPPSNQPSNQP